MRNRFVSAALVAASLWVVPEVVQASPPFELVGSTLGDGGLNARATGADASSAYFNPAFLARAEPGIQLGWFLLTDSIELTLFARKPSNDLPLAALNEFEGKMPALPTEWLERGCDPAQNGRCISRLKPNPRQSQGSSGNTRVYQVFGLVTNIVERYLTLGIYGMIPLDGFLQGQTFFVDEREQFFSNSLHPELYSDRLTAMALAFGVGSQVTDWLALGLGVTLSLTNTADAQTFVGNSAQIGQTLLLDTGIKVTTGVAPDIGAVVTPVDGLTGSVTVHTPQKMEINTGFSTFLPNGDLQRADRTSTLAWEPWKVGVGAQYDFLRLEAHRLGIVAGATYSLWSGYHNRQNEAPQQGYGWIDTFGITFGVRYVNEKRLIVGVDAGYQPTPVPLQTGRTNYVDNDRYSIGANVSYKLPLSAKIALKFGLTGQVHILPERSQTKLDPSSPPYAGKSYSQLVQDEWIDGAKNNRDEVLQGSYGLQTNNPGWPGFSSKGVVAGVGLNASLLY